MMADVPLRPCIMFLYDGQSLVYNRNSFASTGTSLRAELGSMTMLWTSWVTCALDIAASCQFREEWLDTVEFYVQNGNRQPGNC